MAVKIRLARGGAKKKPFYQVVVADERFPRDGRFIENLGQYDPKQDPPLVTLKEDRTLEWLQQGCAADRHGTPAAAQAGHLGQVQAACRRPESRKPVKPDGVLPLCPRRTDSMKDLIEFIAKSLVENPDAVSISEEEAEDGTILVKLAAAQEDMGRIIGKQGRTAKAMRTLLNAKATRENRRANLQIME